MNKPATNGSISSNKIIWWILGTLLTLFLFSAATIKSFVSTRAQGFEAEMKEVQQMANENKRINAVQEEVLKTMGENIQDVKDMMVVMYRFTVGLDPSFSKSDL